MIITNEQISILCYPMREAFIAKTITLLRENTPEWANEKTDDQIQKAVDEMIEAGEQIDVLSEANVQKLLLCQIIYNLIFPFTDEVIQALTYADKGEDWRVSYLVKELEENSKLEA